MFLYFSSKEKEVLDEILNDISIKPNIRVKIKAKNMLIIDFFSSKDKSLESYVLIKYGDYLFNPVEKDRTPIIDQDYFPKNYKTKKQ